MPEDSMKAGSLPWAVLGLSALLGAGACVDGTSPTGLDHRAAAGLAVLPAFSVQPTSGELASLTLARVVAYDLVTKEVMALVEREIDPNASEWAFDLTIRLASANRQVVLTVELVSDLVEWSGRSSPITVAPGAEPAEVRVVSLARGPLENLDVVGIDVVQPPDTVSEGGGGRLRSVLEGGGSGTRAFYRSLSPDVMEVTREGVFRGLSPGDGLIEARAGTVADTVRINVLSHPLASEDVAAVVGGIGDSADRLVPALQDGPGAAAIAQSLTDFEAAVRSRRPASVQDAIAAARRALAAYGTPQLRYQDGPELSLIELVLDYTERVVLGALAGGSESR